MKPLLVGSGCLARIVALTLLVGQSKGTLNSPGGHVLTIIESGEPPVHHATEAQFAVVIDRFLPGDRFDMLWVSRRNDQYSGLMLDIREHKPELSAFFFTKRQSSQIKAFGKAMRAAGYAAHGTPGGYNGGWNEDNLQTDFNISLPRSAKAVIKAVDTALAQLQPTDNQGYYLSASRTADLPAPRQGIVYRPPSDPLHGILK